MYQNMFMKCPKLLSLLFIWCLLSSFINSEESDGIVGVWFTEDRASKIQIFKQDNHYFGKIVWLKSPTVNGKPILDTKNPEEKLRTRHILGLVFLNKFVFEGNNSWVHGEIYDARSGRTVSGKMSLKNKNMLDLRGFIGKPLFGKTVTLVRAE